MVSLFGLPLKLQEKNLYFYLFFIFYKKIKIYSVKNTLKNYYKVLSRFFFLAIFVVFIGLN